MAWGMATLLVAAVPSSSWSTPAGPPGAAESWTRHVF